MRQQKKGELREPCIKAGAFRKAFVLDVTAKGNVSSNERAFPFAVTSIQIFEVERAGMAMQFPLFLRKLSYLIFFIRNII